ncbi:hypothetical protein ACIQ6K_37225 [Streptomyces sp. NPDC096354]|uniref:hypothetical protein n=1 Tax=Streptomyces sp. NPDC096354 TaxID=3366088 RepID=UPI00381C1094
MQALDRAAVSWAALAGKLPPDRPRHVAAVVNYACVQVRSLEDAAALAIASGNLPLAVELLEEGRGVLLAHTLDDSSYRHVHARAPELAERLEEISTALAHVTQPVSSLPEDRNYSPAHHPSSMDRRIALATEHEALVGQIRQIPGLDNFMRPPRYADLQEADAHGPLSSSTSVPTDVT